MAGPAGTGPAVVWNRARDRNHAGAAVASNLAVRAAESNPAVRAAESNPAEGVGSIQAAVTESTPVARVRPVAEEGTSHAEAEVARPFAAAGPVAALTVAAPWVAGLTAAG